MDHRYSDLTWLQDVLADDQTTDRDEVDERALSHASSGDIREAIDKINTVIHQRALDSKILSDLFWEEVKQRYEDGQPGRLGQRVRVVRGSLDISYFKNGFVKKAPVASTRKKFFSQHVARSGKYHYTASDVRFASDWEKEFVFGYENQHARNRKACRHLGEARRYLNLALKTLEDAG